MTVTFHEPYDEYTIRPRRRKPVFTRSKESLELNRIGQERERNLKPPAAMPTPKWKGKGSE